MFNFIYDSFDLESHHVWQKGNCRLYIAHVKKTKQNKNPPSKILNNYLTCQFTHLPYYYFYFYFLSCPHLCFPFGKWMRESGVMMFPFLKLTIATQTLLPLCCLSSSPMSCLFVLWQHCRTTKQVIWRKQKKIHSR